MPYQTFSPPDVAPPPPQTWSNIKVHSNGNFHVAGIVGGGDSMYEQARNTFSSIQKLIETAGGTMDDVTMNHIFLKDWADYAALNKVYAEYFPGDKPARFCIQCGLVRPDFLVEIASIAHIGKR